MKSIYTSLSVFCLSWIVVMEAAFAAPVPVQPEVISLSDYRPRFDNPGVDAIQRYLLIDTRTLDVQPEDGIVDLHPAAVLVLFTGGTGKLSLQPGQTNTGSTNFVARVRYHLAAEGFIIALADAATDFLALPEGLAGHRIAGKAYSDAYLQDLQALINDIRSRFPGKPVWLVGTSRGTLSAARASAELGLPPQGPDGVVLTSPLTGPSGNGDLSSVNVEAIQVPTLKMTHRRDACQVTRPVDARQLVARLTSSPKVRFRKLVGGSQPLSSSCNALSEHGFFGIEQSAVNIISRWIKHAQ